MAFFILLLTGKLLEIANKTRKEYFQIFLRDIWNINYMNDKSIRKILLAYLKTKNVNMRIYQEKGIGNSICDVMVVEDCLIGYEIKSDLDNYSRLNEQVKAYNLFFDRNYIVVSDRHMNSIVDKIPSSWGIICVRENNIYVERNAKKNKNVSRRKQLSILWKLELKNILMKNNMPLYAQKEKGYIADEISKNVSEDMLGEQIVQELMDRDYSVYNAKDYSIRNEMPVTSNLAEQEIIDNLSEEDFTKFTLDKWIEMYQKAQEVKERKEYLYKEKEIVRERHEISYTDISVYPGAPWIDRDIIEGFFYHIMWDMECKGRRDYVRYESITGSWHIDEKKSLGNGSVNAEFKYGIPRYNAAFILEATLNLREIKLYDNGNEYNEIDTIAALEKQKNILEEFNRWIWLDEDRIWKVEEAYNNLFSRYDVKKYDGSTLKFPNMNQRFELYDYQKDAVSKIQNSKNTLLAFDVGAGKTYIMIAAAMNMRLEGVSRKNMFVVPNNIVGQWEKIFTDLYPNAKVLTIEPKTFKVHMRSKVLKQIKEGDYDGIIIAYSCFEMIPLSFNYLERDLEERLQIINDAIYALKFNTGYYQWGSEPLERQKQYITSLTNDLMDKIPARDYGITFEMLEINSIFLDEAHNYKNLPIRTKMKNLNGINTKGSSKCMDMLQKIRSVQKNNGGRGAIFATGTPLCNSIADAYAMQMYLQYDELVATKLDVFDNWVKTFALPEQLFEIDVNVSSYRSVRKFVKFLNIPELSRMFSQIAIFHSMNDSSELPSFNGYSDIRIKKNSEMRKYMNELCDRSEEIRCGEVDFRIDNMLKVSTDGRKAALDLRLVNRPQPYNKYSKVFHCVKNVLDVYRKFEGCSQLIFCDYSTPHNETLNIYQDLKDHFIENGVPEKEIAFVHSCKTESSKVELYKKVNEGKVRILIGSTFKLGIGANVQQRLKAIHHLDVPWRPADMVQREGRIIRRGNENDDVLIYRYIVEGSFDAYSWQILETKQRFISQFLKGTTYQRTATDLDNDVLTYAEVKALALSDPILKQLSEKENELNRLYILSAKTVENKKNIMEELDDIENAMKILEIRYEETQINMKEMEKNDDKVFKAILNDYKNVFTEEFIDKNNGKDAEINICGFYVCVADNSNKKKKNIYLIKNGIKYAIEMGNSSVGNIRRIVNQLKGFDKELVKIREKQEQKKRRYNQLSIEKDINNPYVEQIKECKRMCELLKSKIR